MKGAVREIRKDRNFLARVKLSEQAQKSVSLVIFFIRFVVKVVVRVFTNFGFYFFLHRDAERKAKVRQIFGWGQSQQSELKRMERQNRYRH